MKSRQYTIRNIPERLDQKLRQKAAESNKSLNEAVIETLQRGAGLAKSPTEYHDLDWFFGSGKLGPGIKQLRRDFDRIDPKDWQ